MNKKQRIFLILTGFVMAAVICLVALNIFMPKPEIKPNDIEVSQRSVEEAPAEKAEVKAKEYVNVYFIGKNKHGEEVYKAVKREYNSEIDGSKIKFAIEALVLGPNSTEKSLGVYTEIPAGSRVINITQQPDKIIVNLNSDYVAGGGADSLYKRLYQLIKTVKLNTTTPVYLYIEGEKAEVLGGEGIMLSQPLSNSSLEN